MERNAQQWLNSVHRALCSILTVSAKVLVRQHHHRVQQPQRGWLRQSEGYAQVGHRLPSACSVQLSISHTLCMPHVPVLSSDCQAACFAEAAAQAGPAAPGGDHTSACPSCALPLQCNAVIAGA
eukprot:2212-Heterococcus_DN1.PRE.1